MAIPGVNYVIQKIGDAIINQARVLDSVEQRVEDLKREVTLMKNFLQDADAKVRGGDNSVQAWVKLVWEAANDAEDLIESFATKVYVPGMILPCGFISKFRIRRHNFGLEIKGLKKRIKDIMESADRYGIKALPDDRRERREVDATISGWRACSVEASNSSHVFVRDADKKAILKLLDAKREELSVVSIYGTGGLGKTTLVQKVLDDPQIINRFPNRFWIGVSQDCKIENLLKDLLRNISPGENQENATMGMLQMRLRNSLLGKIYLIVMDDVWDVAVWRNVGNCLPDEKNGSKVLITTRSSTIARAADPDQAYQLRFLDKDESWELFISKAIPREEDRRECEGRLKKLGEQMAERCGGLPLALVVMGSLLSQKGRSIEEWERVSHVWRDNDEEGTVVTRILALSYRDLPYDLKLCFLYLSAFPDDCEIKSGRLIGLWIAEGFIAEREDGLTLEETAENQLEKLIQRSLVHVVSRNPKHVVCRVHDLLRELCISEAKQINFMSVYQGTRHLLPECLRRLSMITPLEEETISRLKCAPRLRALLGFNYRVGFGSYLFVGGLKLIRVIELKGAQILWVLPEEIGGLVNLHYLSLTGRGIKSIPETIKNLPRLQFLDVRCTEIEKMTSAVWEIETLRQVFFPYGALAPNRVQCRWRSLQDLRGASANNWMDDTLHKVKDIKTLEISKINASHHEVLSLNLPQFSRLKYLYLQGESIPWTALTLSGLHLLRTLVLNGPIKSTSPKEVRPEDIPGSLRGLSCLELNYEWPASLTYLKLISSNLHRDPLPSLGQLSELRFLTLGWSVYNWGKEMKFCRDKFKQLQELNLQYLLYVERMTVEDGAMPRLQKLKISACWRLNTIPPRLEDLAEWKDFEWEYSF